MLKISSQHGLVAKSEKEVGGTQKRPFKIRTYERTAAEAQYSSC